MAEHARQTGSRAPRSDAGGWPRQKTQIWHQGRTAGWDSVPTDSPSPLSPETKFSPLTRK